MGYIKTKKHSTNEVATEWRCTLVSTMQAIPSMDLTSVSLLNAIFIYGTFDHWPD